MGKSRFTTTEKHNIVIEYIYNVSPSVIADRHGISVNYVYVLVKQYGDRCKDMIRKDPTTGRKVHGDSDNSFKAGKTRKMHKTVQYKESHEQRTLRVGKEIKQLMKEVSEHPIPDNQSAVRHHTNCRRGFTIPKHLENEYTKLLMTGMPREQAAYKIAPSLNQHLRPIDGDERVLADGRIEGETE